MAEFKINSKMNLGLSTHCKRCVCVCVRVHSYHMNSSSIPNSKGEKNVRTLAALPTGGSAFCGALEDGMGEVLVSGEPMRKHNSP